MQSSINPISFNAKISWARIIGTWFPEWQHLDLFDPIHLMSLLALRTSDKKYISCWLQEHQNHELVQIFTGAGEIASHILLLTCFYMVLPALFSSHMVITQFIRNFHKSSIFFKFWFNYDSLHIWLVLHRRLPHKKCCYFPQNWWLRDLLVILLESVW